jgi:hypothetical protein
MIEDCHLPERWEQTGYKKVIKGKDKDRTKEGHVVLLGRTAITGNLYLGSWTFWIWTVAGPAVQGNS